MEKVFDNGWAILGHDEIQGPGFRGFTAFNVARQFSYQTLDLQLVIKFPEWENKNLDDLLL